MATESTKEHEKISCKVFIFSCFPWIPWPIIYFYQVEPVLFLTTREN